MFNLNGVPLIAFISHILVSMIMFEFSVNNQAGTGSVKESFHCEPENIRNSVWMEDIFADFQSGNPPHEKSKNSILLACETLQDSQNPVRYSFDQALEKSGKKHGDASAPVKDEFKSMEDLKMVLQEGVDYRIKTRDRNSNVTVAAPHGGFIEPGSSELAEAISGDEYNLFDFRGLDNKHPRKAHVTSSHYKDPLLTELLNKSDICLSVHGMRGEEEALYVGGLNKELRELVTEKLTAAGFPANSNPPKFRGEHQKNFINSPKDHGVQLELSWGLRKTIMEEQGDIENPRFRNFVKAVRGAIREYREKKSGN